MAKRNEKKERTVCDKQSVACLSLKTRRKALVIRTSGNSTNGRKVCLLPDLDRMVSITSARKAKQQIGN